MSQLEAAWLPSPETMSQMIAWVRQAGQLALRYFRQLTSQHPPDQSLITQATREIELFLVEQIRVICPDHEFIGKKGRRAEFDHAKPNIWVIDPLDGSTVFTQGLPGWGISIGLLHQGQPHFGLFYMPLLDDLTYTTGQGEIHCNNHHLRQTVRPNWESKGFLAVGTQAHRDFDIEAQRIRAIGSVGASLVYTARGTAAAVLISKAYLWDLAAGAAILVRAGGELRYLSGRQLDYGDLLAGQRAPEPIIAGHPSLLVELQRAIRPLKRSL